MIVRMEEKDAEQQLPEIAQEGEKWKLTQPP
jgi:hypothetical protein